MENDSLNVETVQDSAGLMSVAADSVVPEFQMPTAEQLGISIVAGPVFADGSIQPLSVTIGDTFDFPVTVSWSVNGSALLVVPTSTATARGLEQVGVSQESARSVKDGKEIASITFTYKLVAQDTGSLNVPVLKFEIPTQMGMPLTLRTESVPVRVDEVYNVAPVFVGIAVATFIVSAGIWRMKRRAAGLAALAAKKESQNALQSKMMVLKQRVNSADSRQWLLDLEKACREFVAERLKLDAEKVNLENLQKNGDLDAFGDKEGWTCLLEEFAHARYGGGRRDGFENKETWKLAMKLMGIEEDV